MVKDVLVPKTSYEIYVNVKSDNYVNFIRVLSNKMQNKEDETFFIPFISNEKFHPSEFNNRLFYDACKFNYPKLVKIMLGKPNFDPTTDFYYALRIAVHNNNHKIVNILTETGLFKNVII